MLAGLITYHSAYNYGSVFQAFATQQALNKLNIENEVIDYRPSSQKMYYSLYRTHFGIKKLIGDLCQIPIHNKRIMRSNSFELFINEYIKTSKCFSDPGEFKCIAEKYDLLISGSDQIWNIHSNELENQPFELMKPYLLADVNKRKISFASSIANMTNDELQELKNYIIDFDSISVRENSSVSKIESLLDCQINSVIDPTFLISAEEYKKFFHLISTKEQPYILFYTLAGRNWAKQFMNDINDLAEKRKMRIKLIAPFFYYPTSDRIINCSEYGPIDFLNAINNAEYVITDSFHGTALSLNFEKQVYSISGQSSSDFRKIDLINRLGADNCKISTIKDLRNHNNSIDYSNVSKKISEERAEAYNYLKTAIIPNI